MKTVIPIAIVATTLSCAVLAGAQAEPTLEFTSVPALGSTANLSGTASGIVIADHRVVVYIFVQSWWIKPGNAAPLTVIAPGGDWTADITTGGADPVATKIAAYLVPQTYSPPLLNGAATLPEELDDNALASAVVERQSTNAFHFSGYDWDVKTSGGILFGPGLNFFSDSTDNVWVDGAGKLHLRITHRDDQWQCAEVIALHDLGYGTYRFYLDSAVDALDPNVVLGLFTWSDDPAFAHREIDIEISRWGIAVDPTNAQYVVQPFETLGNLVRWTIPTAVAPTTHSFTWAGDRIDFLSHNGAFAPPPASVPEISQWSYTGANIPEPGDERVRLNLWLFNGAAPTDGEEVEVVINRFVFVPSPLPTPTVNAISRDAQGAVSLDLTGTPQLLYILESSTDLFGWATLTSTIAPEATFQLADPNLPGAPSKYYRVLVPPQ